MVHRIRVPRFAAALGLVVATAGCAGEPSQAPVEERTSGPSTGGVVQLRQADPALGSQMQVHTWLSRSDVQADGSFQAEFFEEMDVRFAYVSKREQIREAMYYGYYFPPEYASETLQPFIDDGQGLVVDARSTALAMTLFNPLLFDSTVEQRVMVATEVLGHPTFPALVAAIQDTRTQDPNLAIRWENTPDLYMMAAQILHDSMKSIADRLPDSVQEAPLVPQGSVSYDYDMAYPQNQGNGKVVLYNPKMAHYVAGVRNIENTGWDEQASGGVEQYFVPGKERWLDISIFPPKLEVVDPTQTPIDIGGEARMMEIYKGFQFDFPFATLWDIPPARTAMYANAWASWNMMISLAGNIVNILGLPFSGVLDYLRGEIVDEVVFTDVYTNVQERDNEATIDSFYDVFVDILPSMEVALKAKADAYYSRISGGNGIMDQIFAIFEGVWSLVSGGGIVNGIIDITTQVIPFYWDLFTAHSHSVYPIYNGGINPLPSSPTISRVYPVTLYNGKNAVVQGFGFGNNGKVNVIGAGAQKSQLSAIVWTGSSVTFKVPQDQEGFGSGEEKQLYIELETSDGKTNSFPMPFVKAEAGEDGGGGGCSVLPSDRQEAPLGWLVMLLVPVAIWRVGRCRAA